MPLFIIYFHPHHKEAKGIENTEILLLTSLVHLAKPFIFAKLPVKDSESCICLLKEEESPALLCINTKLSV